MQNNRQKTKGRKKGQNLRKDYKSNKELSQQLKSEDKDAQNGSIKHNDDGWYYADEQILNDVARLPYSFPVGYPFPRYGNMYLSETLPVYDDAVSGILTLAVAPTIGNAKHPSDAVNVASNGMYTFVRHLNSGSRNYDANDLIIYVMAVDSLYYMTAWATRIYATMVMYHQDNRYTPKDLLEAQGLDFDDFMDNIAQFRAGMNMRIPRISTLLVPAVLPIFQRHSWLFSNYFIEGESMKDQIYQIIPSTWYNFTKDSDEAGMLHANHIPASGIKVSDLLGYLDAMMDPIIDDEDFNIISGDIYKAYQGNVLKLALLSDTMVAGFQYDESVLLQFKNAKCAGIHVTDNQYEDGFFDIVQDSNKRYIITKTPQSALMNYRQMSTAPNTIVHVGPSAGATNMGRLQATWNEYSKDILLTTPHHVVEAKENMKSTRFTLAFHIFADASSPYGFTIDKCYFGSEWPLYFKLTTRHRNISTGAVTAFDYRYDRVMIARQLDTNLANLFRSQWPIISSYKYVPELAIVLDPDDSGSGMESAGRSIFEIDNYTLQSQEVIGRLHDTAIMGEYNIPRIAMFGTK